MVIHLKKTPFKKFFEYVERAILDAHQRGIRPEEPPEPKCPFCKKDISPEYMPIPNINLRQAIETIGSRVLPSLQSEQQEKTVYKDALNQDVQQLAV